MPFLQWMTVILSAYTLFLCYGEYREGKMRPRNFKIICVSETIAIAGMLLMILM